MEGYVAKISYIFAVQNISNMPITTSWYSARKGTEVYHNNSGCTEENNIEPYNVREGTGDKRLCKHCERLNLRESLGSGLVGWPSARSPLSLFNYLNEQAKGK
jgi:hypothetical protein